MIAITCRRCGSDIIRKNGLTPTGRQRIRCGNRNFRSTFVSVLTTTIMLMRGKMNFGNLSRYCHLSEKTFSRQFENPFYFSEFDRIGIEMFVGSQSAQVAASDCGFVSECGKHTYGLGKFYNGSRPEAEKGLEISLLAVADVEYDTAYAVSVWQTPATLASGRTRTDWYLDHFIQDAHCLPSSVRHIATDGYYAKNKFANGVCAGGYLRISKLGHDACLRYLYTRNRKGRGRPEKYDGKIRFHDPSRFEFVGETDDDTSPYTIVANSPSPKRDIGVVCVVRHRGGDKIETALLFSTDIDLPATDIHRFYKARFRIEFRFRDANRFVRLSDCQA